MGNKLNSNKENTSQKQVNAVPVKKEHHFSLFSEIGGQFFAVTVNEFHRFNNLDFIAKRREISPRKPFFAGKKGKFNFTCSSSSYGDFLRGETPRNFTTKSAKFLAVLSISHLVSPRNRKGIVLLRREISKNSFVKSQIFRL